MLHTTLFDHGEWIKWLLYSEARLEPVSEFAKSWRRWLRLLYFAPADLKA